MMETMTISDTQMTTETAIPKVLKGVVYEQYVRCGNAACRCKQGQPHGPYYYRVWRGPMRVHKIYVDKSEVEAVRAACDAYAQYVKQLREMRTERERLSKMLQKQLNPTARGRRTAQ